MTDEEIWETFLLQHYRQRNQLPTEILLPSALKQHELIEEILSEEGGRRVKILQPKMGEKLQLLK